MFDTSDLDISDLCQDTVRIEVGTASTGEAFGVQLSFPASGYRKQVPCWVQNMGSSQALDFKARGQRSDYLVVFPQDQKLQVGTTRLRWIDETGSEVVMLVENYNGEGAPGEWSYWYADCSVVTTRDDGQ